MGALRAQRWRVFWWLEVFWPLVLLSALFSLIVLLDLDLRLSRIFYSPTQGWLWRHNYWLNTIVHDLGHRVMLGVYGLVLLSACACWLMERGRGLRSALAYLLTAVLLSVVVVNIGKRLIHFPCPWDLTPFGGSLPGLLSAYSWATQSQGCFPAGHASSGYAWMCLYFVAKVYRPAWRFYGLGLAVLIGVLFGAAQQLRGAHFLSHDIASMACAWMVAAVVFHFWPKQLKMARAD